MGSSLPPAPSPGIGVPQEQGRLSAQTTQLLVHENEHIVPMLLQPGAVECASRLQGTGQ
ncbi:hypothetical protein [Pseudarthrobacter phenanthrenivorans]|uniref:hypothetical protein n=1 Tax=Pseudarthrobacter phenanthrenivorans TaxID=361575 RepID=UPI002F35A12A